MNLKSTLSKVGVMLALLTLFVGTTLQAQTVSVDTASAQARFTYNLANKATQDTVALPSFKIVVSDTLTKTSDSVAIAFANQHFVFGKGPYNVSVKGSLVADKAYPNAAGDSLFIKIGGPVSYNNGDTLTVSGVYVKAIYTNPVNSDSSTQDHLTFAVGNGASATVGPNVGTTLLVTLPAPIWNASITLQPTSPVFAGATISNVKLAFTDMFGNIPNDKSTSIGVSAVLNGTTTPGNGTLSGTSTITKVVSQGAPGTDTYTWTALSYPKAETIQLVFNPPSGTKQTSDPIVVNPSTSAAHISVVASKTSITVDGTIDYTLTVTDANSNPITGATVTAAETTPHGGTFSALALTNTSGQTTTTFTPSKFYVGSDQIKFTSGTTTQTSNITIGPGAVGGIIVDYSATASGSQSTEAIAAGETVYVRGFLQDTYGNPVNVTDASQVTFSINGVNGKSTHLGTAAMTGTVTETQYPNTIKTAVGVAIPYTVSTNYRSGSPDSVLVSSGGYSLTAMIQNRSNVPTTFKMDQSGTGDSSIVASKYANHITLADTLWDAYGNKVTAPASSYKIAPTRSSYAVYFSTMGLAKFVGTANGTDTTTVDTLYASGGILNRDVSSSTTSGIDTVKSWLGITPSVAKAVPVWITPATYAKLVIMPHKDTTAIAGQSTTLTIAKEDAYGNHIDWGLSGGEARGNTPHFNKPTAAMIASDSMATTVDTVKTGHNRGGSVDMSKSKVAGKAGVASVGGTLNFTVPFTAYAAGADTQKVYAVLYASKDTATIYSMSTGVLHAFLASIAAKDSVHNAGDSVAVTFTAVDSAGHRIYTYVNSGQTLTVNHTNVAPITGKDTTFYFTYVNNHGKYVKSTGVDVTDTVFSQGQGVFYLHKFHVDSTNTVSIAGGGFTATASQGIKFKPLAVDASFGKWLVTVPSTVPSTGSINFLVTPRDKYYNVNTTQSVISIVASNQTSGFNVGSNPKVITGPTSFTGTLTSASGTLIIYVFNYNSSGIYGQSAPSTISTTAAFTVSGTVTYGDGSMGVKNVIVTLNPGGMADTTDATGAYSFANVANGSYTVSAATDNAFLGADATDAFLASKFYNGTTSLSAIQQLAADVNANGQVNNTDALLIVRRFVDLDSSFAAGNWVFTSPKVTVSGSPVTADIQALVTGDVNESDSTQIGTLPKAGVSTVDLATDGIINTNGKAEFVIPVKISGDVNLSALSLRFTYPQDLATFEGVSSSASVISNGANGKVAIAWADFSGGKKLLNLKDGETLVSLKFKPTANFKSDSKFDIQLEGSNSELADANGNVLSNSKLTAATVEVNIPKEFSLKQNYPNPFNPSTIIEYDLPVQGNVNLVIYNILGQRVATLVNQMQDAGTYKFNFNASNLASGAYIYRLSVEGTNGKSFTKIHKMMLLK